MSFVTEICQTVLLRSFEKNVKERKERNILLKRTDAQPWLFVVVAKRKGESFLRV